MSERLLRGGAVLAVFLFLCVSWATYDPMQWPAPVTLRTLSSTSHPCGPLGLLAAHSGVRLFGRAASALVLGGLGMLGVGICAGWSRRRVLVLEARIVGLAAFILAVAALAAGPDAGGILGQLALGGLNRLLGRWGSTLLLAAVCALLLLRLGAPLARWWPRDSGLHGRIAGGVVRAAHAVWARTVQEVRALWEPVTDPEPPVEPRAPARAMSPAAARNWAGEPDTANRRGAEIVPRIRDPRRDAPPRVAPQPGNAPAPAAAKRPAAARFELPGLDILNPVPLGPEVTPDDEYVRLSRALEEKLDDFGIGGRVSEVQPGPVITTYEFEPAPGIKVSQVTSRVDDLAMALRAQSIRMVAPIPGKAAIGIEIPNPQTQIVSLREVMQAWGDDLHVGPLGLALGKTVSGEPFFADLTAMPHLLVAGATGSGKSVCINVLLCSLLLRHDPNEVKLLLIDPKMLELAAYHDIPHLMHPVVTDPKEAYKALHWMTVEMERRYRELARAGVRDISGYNKKVHAGGVWDETGARREPLPYVVVVIDELADLMIQVGNEIETPIARLAQMARAVGIHLVLATQRPSVDVITGVIKANFPSRIAFQVSSRVDSRTILDSNGAETLLGRGDMLFLNAGRPAPIRLHGAFVGMEECERIATHWRSFGHAPGRLDLDEARGGLPGETCADDELFEEAREVVVTSGVASVSYLQRRLKVGYSRAARIMDMLEEAGVVGPAAGARGREVLGRPEVPID